MKDDPKRAALTHGVHVQITARGAEYSSANHHADLPGVLFSEEEFLGAGDPSEIDRDV
jgi:hypothetical protein